MSKSQSENHRPSSVPKRGGQRPDLLIALVLVGLIAAAYWQVHAFGFINYDDDSFVTQNPRVQSGLSVQNIGWALTTDYQALRIPLVWMSFMLDREIADLAASRGIHLGPDNAGIFHLTNVLLHTANTLLLFVLLSGLTGHRYRSAVVAALFAIHPLHVESVAWVTERKDVLSGLFFLITLLSYAAYARKPSIARYALLVLTFVLGLLAKPMLVTLPVLMLLLDYWPLGRLRERGLRLRIVEKLPLALLAVAASGLAWHAQAKSGAVMSADLAGWSVRLANALASYLIYAWQMIWPRGLVPFYPHPGDGAPLLPAVVGGLWLMVATAYALRVRRRRPYVMLGLAWYVISLLPVIGIIQVGSQAHADRYTYLPLIGLFVAMVWFAAAIAEERMARVTKRASAVVASCVVLCALTVLAHYQVSIWRDNLTLFEHTLRYSPGNPLAYNVLGVEMLHANKAGAAADHFRKALAANPDHPTYLNNLGKAMEQMGRLDEAIRCYHDALSGVASRQTIATIQMNLGHALVLRGRCAEALPHVRAALATDPDASGVHNNLGYVLAALGRSGEAESEYRAELRLNPHSFDAHLNLGRLMARRGNWGEAAACYRRAHGLRPDDPAPANGLAWVLATAADIRFRDAKEAMALATFACRTTGYRDPSALDTLAAAYAEAGRFSDAARTAEEAVAIAESKGHKALAATIRQRLGLYRVHRAYHGPG